MQYSMFLEDRPHDIPTCRQRTFPPDHSRRDVYIYERAQLDRANGDCSRELDVMCLLAELKRADQFWRPVLVSKLDALFFDER